MDRTPILHGRFYEADPRILSASVDMCLADASSPLRLPQELLETLPAESLEPLNAPVRNKPVRARAVMLPHAGHMYCGRVLGQTLARCTLPNRLVLLCPNHTGVGDELAVWPDGSWQTPLGAVPVDEELCAALIEQNGYTADPTAHRGEHSLEVLLPFLQRHTPLARIAPVRVSCGPEALKTGAIGLARVLGMFARVGESVGVIISSDMNHFAPEAENMRRDATALAALLSRDPVNLFNIVHSEDISMCGVAPATLALLALQMLAPNAPAPRLTAYGTSAEAAGDAASVVGYAGVVFV